MTGQLQTTLRSRADALGTWDVDVDTIVRAGERRVRRRRIALAGGVAGVLAIVGGVAVATRGHSRPQPIDDGALPVTYALGSVIHSGDSQVDVGMPVASFVRLTDGFVFSHAQHVYEAKDGTVHEIDDLANATTPLVADERGRQAAWWRGRSIDFWPGYPQANGHPNAAYAMLADGWPADSPPRVEAIWGSYLWVTNGVITEVIHHDPPDGPYVSWRLHDVGPSTIRDAADGRLLVRADDGMAVVDANVPRHLDFASYDLELHFVAGAPQVRNVSTGDLAPDGRHWFSAEGDRFTVYASSDGSGQEPVHDGFVGVTPYQWLGADTIAALAHRPGDADGAVSILRCRVSTNSCTVALADVGPEADVVVPSGPTTESR